MIYRGHMINKMAIAYKKTFQWDRKKEVYHFVVGELLFVFKCVIDV